MSTITLKKDAKTITVSAASANISVYPTTRVVNLSDSLVTATGGTTGRKLEDRFADEVSVKDHGVTGDGSTNEATALSAMVTAIGSTATTVVFPPGTYSVGSAVLFPSNLTVKLEPGASFTGSGVVAFRGNVTTLQGRALRKIVANRSSDATVADTRLMPFEVEESSVINRVAGYVGVTDATGKLFEIGIYDRSFAKLTSTEVREIPPVGDFELAIPETTLTRGRYYLGISTNSGVVQFGVNASAGAISADAALPLAATAANPVVAAAAVAASVYGKDLPTTQGLFSWSQGTVRVYGVDVTGGNQPWGWNTATGRLAYSVNNGATWIDAMLLPSLAASGATMIDLLVVGGKVYILTNKLTLWVSSDLTSSATWTDISCPTTAGLRHSQAIGRPYGFASFNGYIYVGEYSQTGAEFAPDGPRILRYEIAAGTWALSNEFAGARHIHSFYAPSDALMWVSIGDAGYSGIGVWRIVQAGIGAGAGGSDTWVAWSSTTAPRTSYYPVDLWQNVGGYSYRGQAAPAGLYMSSDRPGKHVLYCKTTGAAGAFNISAQLFERSGGPGTETVRSIVADTTTGNIYYWTAETTEQALYISPPPYTQAVKLKDFPASPTLILVRAVKSGDYILMFDQRFHIEKFVGQ